jgi:hypothetical protein
LQTLRPTREPRWLEIDEGRAAILDIASASGRLCILGVYLQTGDAADARRHTLEKALRQVPHHTTAATWLLGDFNFVMQPEDRVWYTGANTTGAMDERESTAWHKLACDHSFREIYQPYLDPHDLTGHTATFTWHVNRTPQSSAQWTNG